MRVSRCLLDLRSPPPNLKDWFKTHGASAVDRPLLKIVEFPELSHDHLVQAQSNGCKGPKIPSPAENLRDNLSSGYSSSLIHSGQIEWLYQTQPGVQELMTGLVRDTTLGTPNLADIIVNPLGKPQQLEVVRRIPPRNLRAHLDVTNKSGADFLRNLRLRPIEVKVPKFTQKELNHIHEIARETAPPESPASPSVAASKNPGSTSAFSNGNPNLPPTSEPRTAFSFLEVQYTNRHRLLKFWNQPMTVPEILLKGFVSYWQAFLNEDKAHFPALIFATECQPVGAGRDEMAVISNLVVTHLELYRHSRRNAMYSQALHEVLRDLEGSDFVTREAFVLKSQECLQAQWGARAGELGSVLFDRMVRGIYRLENQQDNLEFLKNENIVHRKLVQIDSRISWVPRVSRAQVNLFCAPQRHRVWRRLNRLQDALDHSPRADKVARSFRKPSTSIQSFKENWVETDLPLDFFNQFVHKARAGPLDAPVCRDVWENVLAKLQDMDIIPPQLATNRRVTRIITEGESQTPELDLNETFKKAKAHAGHLVAPVEHMEIPGLKPAKRDEETPSFQALHMDAIRSPALDTRFFRDGYKSCVEFSLITGKPLSTVVELAEIVVQEGIDKHAPILGYEEICLLAADLEVDIQWEGQLVDQWRPPVVTVMGHVDHGKTTILDFFRGTRTVEDGGITQKIGAFSVPTSTPILDGSEDLEYDDLLTSQFPFICFVDTPGHAAFRNMRMGGANIMDIILLVVAAEDGAQPQTLEALELAIQAKVPIVLCVNKVDQLDASEYDAACQTVLESLEAHAYPVSLFSTVIPISGKQGINMSLLRRTILDVASGMETLKLPAQEIVDYQQLAASRLKRQISPQVHVLEYLNSDLGPLISGIVISGELRESDAFCLGHRSGKLRTMLTEEGKPLKRALPSMPVSLACQWTSDRPVDVTKGDKLEIFLEGPLAAQLEAKRRAAIFKSDLTDAQPEGTIGTASGQHVNLILKADCEGSLVAMSTWIKENYGEAFRLVDQSVGKITPADINLLVDSQAFLLAFNSPLVDPSLEAPPGAIREYTVIYRMFEECKLIFDFHFSDWYLWDRKCRVKIYKKGQYAQKRIVKDVAGFKVLEGNVSTNLYFDVLRDFVVVATKRQIDSIMVGSQAVSEVTKGGEAGVIFDESYSDFEEGDEVLGYSRRIRDPLFGSFASRRFGT